MSWLFRLKYATDYFWCTSADKLISTLSMQHNRPHPREEIKNEYSPILVPEGSAYNGNVGLQKKGNLSNDQRSKL